MGGFGRFQWISTIILTLARNGGNWIYYGFVFLTMEQMYLCRFDENDPFQSCSAEEQICPAIEDGIESMEYKVDTSYAYYLNNWYVQMDFVCTNKVNINSMISFQYIVFGIAGLLFFAMPDNFGRRTTMNIWFGVHVAAQILILFD